MSRRIIIMAVIAVVLLIAAIWIAADKTAGTYEKEVAETKSYFINFKDKIEDIQKITMRSRGQEFNVELLEGQWVLPDPARYFYPVGIEKVRDIVVNASQLEIIEKKTNKPEELSILGLDTTDTSSSDAVHITFYDVSGKVVADFVAGKRRLDGGRTFYARHADNNQAYLVSGEGWLNLDLSPGHWLDSELYRIAKERIQSATFAHNADDAMDFTITRNHAGAKKFRITELGERKIIKHEDVANAAFALSELQPVGINPITHFDFTAETVNETVFKTFDGLVVTVKYLYDADKDMWISLSAETLYTTSSGQQVSDAVKEEADMINDRAAKWAYIVSDDTKKRLSSRFEVLTEE